MLKSARVRYINLWSARARVAPVQALELVTNQLQRVSSNLLGMQLFDFLTRWQPGGRVSARPRGIKKVKGPNRYDTRNSPEGVYGLITIVTADYIITFDWCMFLDRNLPQGQMSTNKKVHRPKCPQTKKYIVITRNQTQGVCTV